MLIPQRAGPLLYPAIEIRALAPQKTGDAQRETPRLPSPVSCETDYVNQGETILVLPNTSSVTASLDSGGPGGGAWVVESWARVKMGRGMR